MPQTIVTCFPVSEALVQKMRSQLDGRFDLVVSDQDRIADDLHKADVFFGHAKVPVNWPSVVEGRQAGLDSVFSRRIRPLLDPRSDRIRHFGQWVLGVVRTTSFRANVGSC